MRKLLGTLVALLMLGNLGCIVPIYSPDQTRRTQQLLVTSENLRVIPDEWERAWFLDMPNHMVKYRVHGGL